MGPTKAMNARKRTLRQRRPFEREQIIADALVDFASELRLTDAAELMSMISTPARRWPIVSRKNAQTAAWRNSMSISTVGVASHGALKLADRA